MTKHHHPQYRFAKMMVERISLCVDLNELECWKHDTVNVYRDYPHGRKMVQRAIADTEHRICVTARLQASTLVQS